MSTFSVVVECQDLEQMEKVLRQVADSIKYNQVLDMPVDGEISFVPDDVGVKVVLSRVE
jgi:hypothetical protein